MVRFPDSLPVLLRRLLIIRSGKIAYGRRRTEKKNGTRNETHVVEQSEYPIYEGIHEAIISEEEWNLAQEKRSKNNYRREKVNDPEHAHILSGIRRCPCCGKGMYGNVAKAHSKDNKTRYYYYCKNTVNATRHKCTFRTNIEQSQIDGMLERLISAMTREGKFKEAIQIFVLKGKRSVDWNDVKTYLVEYVGEFYKIASSGDVIYIGSDLPDEYTGSKYTHNIKGTAAKAKANAAQGIPELIEIAQDKHFKDNQGEKHQWNARYGWYRYNSRFALPVFAEDGSVERYNVFHASLLIRHDNSGKLYLYDIIDIKKETSNPLES